MKPKALNGIRRWLLDHVSQFVWQKITAPDGYHRSQTGPYVGGAVSENKDKKT